MSAAFDFNELRQILKDCPERERDHHLGRSFMSAYQIAIRFAETHQLPQAEIRELARRIAFFLSKAVKDKEPGIEGGFISHEFIGSGPWFVDSKGQGIRPSRRVREHSIFRWVPKAGAT